MSHAVTYKTQCYKVPLIVVKGSGLTLMNVRPEPTKSKNGRKHMKKYRPKTELFAAAAWNKRGDLFQ